MCTGLTAVAAVQCCAATAHDAQRMSVKADPTGQEAEPQTAEASTAGWDRTERRGQSR